ncbi:phosphotransferase family protein [Streptodolium elevatio]
MKEQPSDLHDACLRETLALWGIEPAAMAYAAVGFGDHHWSVEGADGRRWFATVADLTAKAHCGPDPGTAFDGLRRAMDTAAVLADQHGGALEFVVAPLRVPGSEDTVARMGRRYALSVFPHIAATSGHFGDELDAEQRGSVIDLLARLHRVEGPGDVPVADVRLPHRRELEAALADASAEGARWGGGPYAESARALLAEYAGVMRRRLAELDAAAERVDRDNRRPGAGLVVTHGEPHPGNLLRDDADRLLLVDWDTVGLAAPERDLWHVVRDSGDSERYAEASGRAPDAEALAFYRMRWSLVDTMEFVELFRGPHPRTRDTDDAWRHLGATLADLAESGG